MIDREARNIAAYLMTRYQDGRIPFDRLKNDWPDRIDDPALREIPLLLRPDLAVREADLGPARKPAEKGPAAWEKCILFLRSDREYRWPPIRRFAPGGPLWFIALILAAWLLLRFLGYRIIPAELLIAVLILAWLIPWLIRRSAEPQTEPDGDPEAWPFLTLDHYRQTRDLS
ncbi:MAG: hypothetical protein GXY33_03600 [Phycisphaerae bacterium]|nr:hypothetical protein [Phycisphaerae bacterium]